MTSGRHILLIGGARSGKSRYAETLASRFEPVIYMATAEIRDEEMQTRIEAHRQRRDKKWTTLEIPLCLGTAIAEQKNPKTCILVDCLTLWLTNIMAASLDCAQARQDLLESMDQTQGTLILVSNEVGLGLVPETALGRYFRDEAGQLNQEMAQKCDEVIFLAAGLPLRLKG